MIAGLLPPSVVTFEGDPEQWTGEVLPAEAGLVATAVDRRRRQFAAGRRCARLGLSRLGWPDYAILAGGSREPLWPPGIVGSITHCEGYCAASVAERDRLAGVGIDAEVNLPLPTGVAGMVCTDHELGQVVLLGPGNWQTVIFSAKESVYKAWFPLTNRWLGHLDAELTIDAERGAFGVRILVSAPELDQVRLTGRFALTPTHVLTAVAAELPERP